VPAGASGRRKFLELLLPRRSLLLAITLFAVSVFCRAQVAGTLPPHDAAGAGSASLGPVVEARHGETCIVCGEPLGEHDPVYLIDGQRVPVHRQCDALLTREPNRYLAAMRPRGAFLGADTKPATTASWMWLAIGAWVLAGLVCGGLGSYVALNRGLPPARWFFLGFCLNALSLVALLARASPAKASPDAGVPRGLVRVPSTHAPRPCPHCGKLNHPSASACSRCGAALEPAVESEVPKAGLRTG
jgi:hypothetical protein